MVEETKQPAQQETQPAGASQAPKTSQQTQVQTQPTQTKPGTPAGTTPGAQPSIQPVKKKSKWWIWLIVGIVVLAIATGALFLFDVF